MCEEKKVRSLSEVLEIKMSEKQAKKCKFKPDNNINGQDLKGPKHMKTSEQPSWFSWLLNTYHSPVKVYLWDAANDQVCEQMGLLI